MPSTRLGWFTLYMAGIELLLVLLEVLLLRFGARGAGMALDFWVRFLGFVFFIFFAFLALRWFRNYAMWWLRNRLIVTYLFIGGVPVFLVLAMAGLSGYFLLGQFATFLAVSGVQSQLQHLQTENAAVVEQVETQAGAAEGYASETLKYDAPGFPDLRVMILQESERPAWLVDGFHSLVSDGSRLYLRVANSATRGGRKMMVVSSVPLDQRFLGKIAADLGPITLDPLDQPPGENQTITVGAGRNNVVRASSMTAGTLPPAKYSWDFKFPYLAFVQTRDWQPGESERGVLLTGDVRLSTLYARLSVSASQYSQIVSIAMAGMAILFGLIVLVALIIGFRLTRTITYSVANLYQATQYINRGDFSHRIRVRQRDQLGELQIAFNSMTESVEKLIAEQKEKERLQSELEIAQEVQAQLFPTELSSTETLELFGICRPARIVSGDYYDFLSYGQEQIGVAVGDISGKGISAALLMASIHSAVRAYEHEQLVAVKTRAERLAETELPAGSVALAIRQAPPQSPSQVLWLLNRHLHKTTQPEKYATLFLGFYDGISRTMTYSNAGHLPPLILSADGSIRRLGIGGTVVGLFDAVDYDEATVELNPGDIFVAFSDGITEPENEFGEFGEARLIETIQLYRHLPLERVTENVIAAVQDWIGSTEQPDDITLVLARPRG